MEAREKYECGVTANDKIVRDVDDATSFLGMIDGRSCLVASRKGLASTFYS
jgi:hypothetical protein